MSLDELKKEAKSKKTSAARLEELARHSDTSIQLAVANNPSASAVTLEYLSGHGKFNILKAVAKHPNTSDAILAKLARHKQVSVREALLRRSPIAPDSVREALAKDPDANIRVLLAVYQGTFPLSPSLADVLSRDTDAKVRGTLVANSGRGPGSSWSEETWERLRSDPDPAVRAQVVRVGDQVKNMEVLERFVRDPDATVRASFADTGFNTLLKQRADLLELLINDPDPHVRVVGYKYGDKIVWEKLIDDSSPVTRAGAGQFLRNRPKDLDDKFIVELARDPDPKVRLSVATSFYNGIEPVLPDAAFWSLAYDSDLEIRLAALQRPESSLGTLRLLADDPEVQIRYHVVSSVYLYSSAYGRPSENDPAVLEILKRLASDLSTDLFRWGQGHKTIAQCATDRLDHLQSRLRQKGETL